MKTATKAKPKETAKARPVAKRGRPKSRATKRKEDIAVAAKQDDAERAATRNSAKIDASLLPPKAPVKKAKAKAKKAPAKKKPAPKSRALVKGNKSLVPTDGKKGIAKLAEFIEQRDNILAFVHSRLVEGRDYGFTHPKANKQEIWKSGCEKIISWLDLATPKFFPDKDAWEMLGGGDGTVMLRCYLVRRLDMPKLMTELVKHGFEHEEKYYRLFAEAEGRGAAELEDGKIFDKNAAVKKCEIRCQKDAVLRLGLSGEFGQDESEYLAAVAKAKSAHQKAKEAYAEPKRKVDVDKDEAEIVDAEIVETKETKRPDQDANGNIGELEALSIAAYKILDSGKMKNVAVTKKFRDAADRNMKEGNAAAMRGLLDSLRNMTK